MDASARCPLCMEPGGALVWRGPLARVVLVDDPDYPGYCRIVWNDHLREMSDLTIQHRAHLWQLIDVVERVVRAMLVPDKINLASLGNQVAHLHWHVIPRWNDDRHFPNPIWGSPRQGAAPDTSRVARAQALPAELGAALRSAFPW